MENNYQLSRIHNYVNGLMSKEDMYVLEREALEDPFLQDAIDGYRMQNGVDTKQLSILQQRLATRVQEQIGNRNQRFYSWQRLAIGMTAGVMFITVCTLILLRYLPNHQTVDMKEVVITDVAYEYTVTPFNVDGNVSPVGGWESFYKLLYTQYSNNQNYNGSLHITFDVDADKKANNIQIKGLKFDYDEELVDIIRNKIKWQGTKGDFALEMSQIGL